VSAGNILYDAFAAGSHQVKGFLGGSAMQSDQHFVPPSTLAQKRCAIDKLRWPRREDARYAVDLAFQKSLVRQGIQFSATGQITVHKIAAAKRYLSCFDVSVAEQEILLAGLESSIEPNRIAEILANAKATGNLTRHRRKLSRARMAIAGAIFFLNFKSQH